MRVVVTGNSSGIGAAIWRTLLEHGHTLVGTHIARAVDYRIVWDRCYDVRDDTAVEELFERAGQVDILINNAGVLDEQPFGRLTKDGMRAIFDMNFIAPMLCAQEAVARGASLIINIGSYYGVSGAYGTKPTYAASKAALHNSTLSLARSLDGRCRVVAIAPGIIERTRIHDRQGGLAKHGDGRSLLHRPGLPEEVASTVLHVINNSYINGTVIEVHGGR
jgi:3-oxoacyl-[acyl-carrier protein] reductase